MPLPQKALVEQARTQGGFTVANEPPRSFKFRFKINGMRAHCVRARFRDRSRPCFIACAFNFQGSDRCRARKIRVTRGGELLTALSRRLAHGQGGSFRCKTVSTASVRKGAMTRRRAPLHSFLPATRTGRVQSHRFSGRLAYGEGISERNPASKIDQHRRLSTSGRCWAAADRSPAADIVLELRRPGLRILSY